MSGNLITPRVQEWLRNGRPARILHIFNEVCNLVNDRGEVISLVSPQIGPGPFTLVVEGAFTRGLDVNQAVSVDYARRRLMVGSLTVDFGETAVWQPKPEWKQFSKFVIPAKAGIQKMDACLRRHDRNVHNYLIQTLDGITQNDMAAFEAGVYGLAGRGVGLTPTGDDVLLGVLYGLWVWQPRRKWMDMIVATAVPRTTTLSANFLRAAAAGEAVWQWHELVNGRANAVQNILSIGHTSGADAWAGFTSMFRMFGGVGDG